MSDSGCIASTRVEIDLSKITIINFISRDSIDTSRRGRLRQVDSAPIRHNWKLQHNNEQHVQYEQYRAASSQTAPGEAIYFYNPVYINRPVSQINIRWTSAYRTVWASAPTFIELNGSLIMTEPVTTSELLPFKGVDGVENFGHGATYYRKLYSAGVQIGSAEIILYERLRLDFSCGTDLNVSRYQVTIRFNNVYKGLAYTYVHYNGMAHAILKCEEKLHEMGFVPVSKRLESMF